MSEVSKPSRTVHTIFLYIYIYNIYIFPGQCHSVISNLTITRIILNPFYNAAVYTAYSEPTMHCIHLVILYIIILLLLKIYFVIASTLDACVCDNFGVLFSTALNKLVKM